MVLLLPLTSYNLALVTRGASYLLHKVLCVRLQMLFEIFYSNVYLYVAAF